MPTDAARPRALRIRTGCDAQPVPEVAHALARFGDRYLERVYTPAERRVGGQRGAESLAARFAGKEAVLKLVGRADGSDPREIEITAEESGRPVVTLHGTVAEAARDQRIGDIDLGLTHAGGLALAVAVALEGEPPCSTRR